MIITTDQITTDLADRWLTLHCRPADDGNGWHSGLGGRWQPTDQARKVASDYLTDRQAACLPLMMPAAADWLAAANRLADLPDRSADLLPTRPTWLTAAWNRLVDIADWLPDCPADLDEWQCRKVLPLTAAELADLVADLTAAADLIADLNDLAIRPDWLNWLAYQAAGMADLLPGIAIQISNRLALLLRSKQSD